MGIEQVVIDGAKAQGDLLMNIFEGIGEKASQGLSLLGEAAGNLKEAAVSKVSSVASSVKESFAPNIDVASASPEHGIGNQKSLAAEAPSAASANNQFASMDLPKDLVTLPKAHDMGTHMEPVTASHAINFAQQQQRQEQLAVA